MSRPRVHDLDTLYRFAAFEPAARALFARVAQRAGRALGARQLQVGVGRPGHALVRVFDCDGRPIEAALIDADALVGVTAPIRDLHHLSVPLRSGEEPIGALRASFDDARDSSSEDCEVLQALADAMVDELLLRVQILRMEEKEAYLASEKEVLQHIAAGDDLTEIARGIADFVERQSSGSLCMVRMSGATCGGALLAAPTLPEVFVDAYVTLTDALDAITSSRSGDTSAPDHGITTIADLASPGGPAPELESLAELHDLRAWWSAPFGFGENRCAIDVLRSTPGGPSPDEVRVLTVAATIGRLALARAESEQRVRRSEEYYRSLIEKAADLTLVLNEDGTVRYLSPSAVGTFGDIAGDGLVDRISAGDRDHVSRTLRWLIASKGPATFEFRAEVAGVTRYFGATASNLLETAVIGGIVLNARDLTDRRTAEEALRESEERYRLVSRTTSDVVWDWNPATNEVIWTASLEKVFGYVQAAIEHSWSWWEERIHPEDKERTIAHAHAIVASDATEYVDEYRFRRADGSFAVVADRAYVFRNDRGEAVRVVGALVDVTHRRELEAQLRHSQRMEAVGQLAGGVAHDFNNMLTAILGFTRLLADEVPEEGEAREFLHEITRASERAGALTRQLLAFSRCQVLQPAHVDLNATVLGMQPMLRRLIGEHVTIATELDPTIPPTWADAGQIEQVIMNLVVNARDAMPEGGVLTIATAGADSDEIPSVESEGSLSGCHVRLTVEDTGCGMSPEVLARVFEPFFTTKGPAAGTGLGLATVYGIVRQSGGHIAVSSAMGRGSRFDVFLPQTPPDLEPRSDVDDANKDPSSGRVLVVDDDGEVRDLAGRMLRGSGFEVRTAEHGDGALEIVRDDFEPDLLLTDLVLPRMSGRTVAERVAALVPGVRTIFMSGYVGHHLGPDEIDAEGTFLEKPFTLSDLTRSIEIALDPGRTVARSASEVSA